MNLLIKKKLLKTTIVKNYNKYGYENEIDYSFFDNLDVSNKKKNTYGNSSPTDLTRHLNEKILNNCLKFITREEIDMGDKSLINIETVSKQIYNNNQKGYENVSEITGLAIPLYYEYKIKKKLNKLIDELLVNKDIKQIEKPNEECLFTDIILEESKETVYNIFEINDNLKNNNFVIEQFLYMCNSWNSSKNNTIFKIKQINNYNWLSSEQLEICINRLDNLNLSNNSIFEKKYEIENENELQYRKLIGYCDCIDNNNLYEFKCVKKLEEVHFLQLGIYIYMNELEFLNNYLDVNKEIKYIKNKKEYFGKISKITKKYIIVLNSKTKKK